MNRHMKLIGLGFLLLWTGATRTVGTEIVRGIYCHPGAAFDNRIWTSYGAGYSTDTATAHSGRSSIRCANTDDVEAHGAMQAITFHQEKPRPLIVAGWARLEGVVGKLGYRCSVYLDLTLVDGKSWPMKIAAFDPAKKGWQYAEKVYMPPAPLASARVYAFLRQRKGTAWFDDLYVGEILDEKGTRSPNLLRNPGFEPRDNRDYAARKVFFDRLDSLGCNAFHFYRGIGWDKLMTEGDSPPPIPGNDPLPGFVQAAHKRGFRVWLTVGAPLPPIRDANSPNFPFYGCVNGPWGAAYTRAVAYFAQSGVDGIGVVPDEWTYSNGRIKRAYGKRRDPVVAEFYKTLPSVCNCPVCRAQFTKRFSLPFPDVTHPWRSADPAWGRLLQFRYDATTAWIQRTIQAAKAANPRVITDTMICVLPVCSDNRIGAGAAWDEIGARTRLDCLQTDPYIFLHNYRGDSTHYYPTETTLHLAAANYPRRAGVTLEACRLRNTYRSKDPAEVYGAALSCLAHGAREFFWWHLNHLEGKTAFVDPEPPSRRVRAFYELAKQMEPVLSGAAPPGEILVLYSRASEDAWDRLAPTGVPAVFGDSPNPKRGFLAHKNVLYWLLRRGYPFQVTFLDNPAADRLAAAKILLLPFPFALSDAHARLIEEAASSGKTVVLLSELAPFDALGEKRLKPALAHLFGNPVPEARTPGPVSAALGRGRIVFLGDDFAARLFQAIEPVRDPKTRVPLPAFDKPRTTLLASILDQVAGKSGCVFGVQPPGDIEATVLDGPKGRLLVAINWETNRSLDAVFRAGVLHGAREATGVGIDADANVTPRRLKLPKTGDWRLHLEPQQAFLLHLQ